MCEKRGFGRALAIFACAFFCGVAPYAQDKAGGTIVFAEGREFSIVRSGLVSRFDPGHDEFLGYELRDGDLLQTGASTFVEVQLRPKGSMLKIAENSSFLFQRIEDSSSAGLQLIYGRVRAKVAKVSGSESFAIRSRQTTAGVRGTDFGFDSVVSPGSAGGASVALSVYAFSGEVAVAPVDKSSASFSLKAGESLAVDLSSSVPFVEKRPLADDVREYWSRFDFKGSPPIAPPASGLSAAPAAAPSAASAAAPSAERADSETTIRYVAPDFRPFRSALIAKNTAIGASALLNAAGVAILAVGAGLVSSGDTGFGPVLLWGGGAVVGASTSVLVYSFFIRSPETKTVED